MNRVMKSCIALAGLASLATVISPVAGWAYEWTGVGSTFTIDEGDASLFSVSGGTLSFTGSEFGTIEARINVTNPLEPEQPDWDYLEMTFQDPDGTGYSSQVLVQLYRVSYTTGSFTLVTGASLNSNSFAGTGVQNKWTCFTSSFGTYPLGPYGYYVYVKLSRSSGTAPNPKFHLANLGICISRASEEGMEPEAMPEDSAGDSMEESSSFESSVVSPSASILSSRLRSVDPNPARREATISFSLAEAGAVELTIFDVAGRRVRSLMDEIRSSGDYSIRWDGRDEAGSVCASGPYFVQFNGPGDISESRKLLLAE